VRWLRALVANPMEAWPAAVYKEPLVISRIMGRQITYVMSPDLIREVLQNQSDAFQKCFDDAFQDLVLGAGWSIEPMVAK
jgi:hypothetical protein